MRWITFGHDVDARPALRAAPSQKPAQAAEPLIDDELAKLIAAMKSASAEEASK